ncbi:MAG: DUF3137 domain-containing protein [Oceanicaulis sp.]|uniref:DUF3137 domain-containing protein n=1 Tax=Glycocaulis sp. TaxID=1969725 RepID=UPI0025C10680|nr:DUF3137 domain-containing protein [Glycocaulis sp.]MCC5981707.1 DUF3137 domain-containing protein [Oceanicaulis sp.]MCH8522533.1 DUF3137 domain-containing protein [Glycocaulis sp.]
MRDFDSVWTEIEPWLTGLEERRAEAVKRLVNGILIAIPIAIAVMVFTLLFNGPPPLGVFGAVLAAAAVVGLAAAPLNTLRKEVKEGLNNRLAEAFGLRYSPKPVVPAQFDSFRSHGLVPRSDRRSFEDHFEGEAFGARFELYEAELKQRRRSRRRTYYVTVFRGVLIRVEFPRTIEGVTLITRDQGIFNALDGLMRSANGRRLERIGLVDPKFERIFQVYGTDQVMARYLMTPTFMERVLALETALKGKNVRAVFDESLRDGFGKGEMLLAAETGNLFEPGSLFQPLNARVRVEALYRDFELIEEIIALILDPDHTTGASQPS